MEEGSLQSLLKRNGYISNLGLKGSDSNDTKGIADTPIPRLVHKELDLPEMGEELDEPSTDLRRKQGGLSVYKYYLTSSGFSAVGSFLFFVALWVVCTEFSSELALTRISSS